MDKDQMLKQIIETNMHECNVAVITRRELGREVEIRDDSKANCRGGCGSYVALLRDGE